MIEITYTQLIFGISLVLANAVLSFMLNLGIWKTLLWSTLRGGIQLAILGWILLWLFAQTSSLPLIGVGVLMLLVACRAVVARCKHRYSGIYLTSLLSLFLSAVVTVGVGLKIVAGAQAWYQPSVALPLVGMVLGNSLNAISLGLNRFLEDLFRDQGLIETKLALGATRMEAARATIRSAIETGLVPMLNLMTVVGVVSLPGTMTGLLVSGTDPMTAIKFQFLIIILVMTCSLFATVLAVYWSFYRLFNKNHQLQLHELKGA